MRSLPSFPVMLARGLTRRCARCGGGKLFRLWVVMVPECPRCGLRFEREEGGWLGGVVINIGATQLVVIAYLVLGLVLTWPDPHVPALIVGGVMFTSAFAFAFNPFSKTIWVAIDLWLRSHQREDLEDVDRFSRARDG